MVPHHVIEQMRPILQAGQLTTLATFKKPTESGVTRTDTGNEVRNTTDVEVMIDVQRPDSGVVGNDSVSLMNTTLIAVMRTNDADRITGSKLCIIDETEYTLNGNPQTFGAYPLSRRTSSWVELQEKQS